MKLGETNWEKIFSEQGARWFHTGGIFCALSETTPAVVREAMEAAKRGGTIISYDLNYRASLWSSNGGKENAQAVNRALVSLVDVLFGNEEDFTAALGYEVEGVDEAHSNLDPRFFQKMIEKVKRDFPGLSVVATTLRSAKTATRNDWSAIAHWDGKFYEAVRRENLEIFDRVGGGDSFASGLIYGLLSGKDIAWALECGVVHGALAMTTPGDTSMASLQEILQIMKGGTARISR
jgi:2-dehydro-3-deoxygluconokinase